jgi:hypothetical protein
MPAFIRTGNGLSVAERNLAAATVGDMRETVVNLTDLRPLYSTVLFQAAANTIAANTTRTAFADKLTEADGAGFPVSLADATFFDGEAPTGQLIVLEGLGFDVAFGDAGATGDDMAQVQRNISVVMNLRGTSVRLGSLEDWPGVGGVSTLDGNGRTITDVRRFPEDNLIVLEPLDDFSIFLRTERAIATSFLAGDVFVSTYLPATRVLDQRVLGLS